MTCLKNLFVYKCDDEKNNKYEITLCKEKLENNVIVYTIWLFYNHKWNMQLMETDHDIAVKYYKKIIAANVK